MTMIAIDSPKDKIALRKLTNKKSFSFISHTHDGKVVRCTAFYYGGWNTLPAELCLQFPSATYAKGSK